MRFHGYSWEKTSIPLIRYLYGMGLCNVGKEQVVMVENVVDLR
jgi:hypothetical protein